jgi:hypothetical protein
MGIVEEPQPKGAAGPPRVKNFALPNEHKSPR